MNITKTPIIIYSIVTVLIVILLNIYIANNDIHQSRINKIDNNYAELNKAITSDSSDDLLLVIGNSYVNTSFNPSLRQKSTVKFAVNAMTLADIVSVVENLPEKTPIKAILIGTGYYDVTPSKSNSSSYEKHFSTNIISKMWYSLPMVRGRSKTSEMLREDIHCLISSVIKTRCKQEVFEETKDKEAALFADPKYREKDIKEKLKVYTLPASSMNQNFNLFLERITAACKLRGIKLYAYTAPVYKDLLHKLDEDVIAKFNATILENEINHIDMNLLFPDWDYTMFSDATHVNPDKASKQITKTLLDWIATL
ncbi:MAG TPA: hypothetical protein PLB54_02980 [Nitrosomonas sp.]|nr:hypothetical protein [Nitrosomonas sp.]